MRFIVGIDEAGRGPLAGPVTVAALVQPVGSKFNKSNFFDGIRDSKKLSAKKRDVWFSKIKKNHNFRYSVSCVSNAVIDKKGITYATRLAIKRCLKKLFVTNKLFNYSTIKLLLDGSLHAPSEYQQETIIKGDEKISVISAASIVAKVTRDRKMMRLAKKFPLYNFDQHKGYGTKLHRELVLKNGLSEIHRVSFCTKLI
ncbi:ribonuclease HII [Candidatus Giovannonibacteria bacterium]|nr:ribonuclease HII [Candidatus Giovannonibacteria bacterium]